MKYLKSLIKNKCPHCRQGDLFCSRSAYTKGFMKMPEKCSQCGQRTEIEEGFYFGAAYISYGLTVAISAATFVAWYVIIGMSLNDNRFFWWMGSNAFFLIILQPWLMRFSRTIWLSLFVKFSTEWREEQNNENEIRFKKQVVVSN